jgi:hypothetical protein
MVIGLTSVKDSRVPEIAPISFGKLPKSAYAGKTCFIPVADICGWQLS